VFAIVVVPLPVRPAAPIEAERSAWEFQDSTGFLTLMQQIVAKLKACAYS